jgi:hypothetical protein
MSAAEALRAAHAAGITVRLDDGGLLLEAVAEPPLGVLDGWYSTSAKFSIC